MSDITPETLALTLADAIDATHQLVEIPAEVLFAALEIVRASHEERRGNVVDLPVEPVREIEAVVLEAPVVTRLNMPPIKVLAGAAVAGLREIVVLGFDADGEFFTAASIAGGPEMLWMLELAKKRLFEVTERIGAGEIPAS